MKKTTSKSSTDSASVTSVANTGWNDRILNTPGLQTALLGGLFILLILNWAVSDLWFDEIMTLQLYVLPSDTIGKIFRNYSEANNHFLNSAIWWIWQKVIDPLISEPIMRLPAIFCGLGTIAIACYGWRDRLSPKRRLAAAAMIAASPVICAFAYQMRGYSVGMLLGCLSLTLAMKIGSDSRARIGLQTAAAITGLLLPFAAPTCAMAAMPAALVTVWLARKQTKSLSRAILRALPGAVATAAGIAYYATIWNQFKAASQSAGGWDSYLAVAGNVLLAIAIHAILVFVPACRKNNANEQTAADARKTVPVSDGQFLLIAHAATILAVLAATLLFTSKAPYPRIFTVLFPGIILSLWASVPYRTAWCDIMSPALILCITFVWGLAVMRFSDITTACQIANGKMPQNLLQQYYRGSSDSSTAVRIINDQISRETPALIIIPAVDEFSFQFYWQITGCSENATILPVNRITPATHIPPRTADSFVFAQSGDEAARMLTIFNENLKLSPVTRTLIDITRTPLTHRHIYRLKD